MLEPDTTDLSLANADLRQTMMRDEIMQGLQSMPKKLPSKYLYDEQGVRLFEKICEQEEYYPTRTELAILSANIGEIVDIIGPYCQLIEYGSGSGKKTRLLLDALPTLSAYVPIDIAREYLLQATSVLTFAYPRLEIRPVWADYTNDFEIPVPHGRVEKRVAYFSGSTIGNFDRDEARDFLSRIAQVCAGGGLLIGVDLKKNANVLHRAYNDRQGVTARFNLNLLKRINAELGANFRLDQFGHYAFYNPIAGRVEMHLISMQAQTVQIGDCEIPFKEGESIWTESSYKYTLEEFAQLAEMAGFYVKRAWTDPQQLFSVQYLQTN